MKRLLVSGGRRFEYRPRPDISATLHLRLCSVQSVSNLNGVIECDKNKMKNNKCDTNESRSKEYGIKLKKMV